MLEKTSTVKQNKLLRNKMNGGKMKQAIHKLSSNTMGFSQKRKTKKRHRGKYDAKHKRTSIYVCSGNQMSLWHGMSPFNPRKVKQNKKTKQHFLIISYCFTSFSVFVSLCNLMMTYTLNTSAA